MVDATTAAFPFTGAHFGFHLITECSAGPMKDCAPVNRDGGGGGSRHFLFKI